MVRRAGLVLSFVAVAAFGGCKKKPEGVPLPNAPIDAAVPDDPAGEVRRMADRMCACADLACVDRVQRELATRGHHYRDSAAPDATTAKAIAAEAERLEACARRVATPDAGR